MEMDPIDGLLLHIDNQIRANQGALKLITNHEQYRRNKRRSIGQPFDDD